MLNNKFVMSYAKSKDINPIAYTTSTRDNIARTTIPSFRKGRKRKNRAPPFMLVINFSWQISSVKDKMETIPNSHKDGMLNPKTQAIISVKMRPKAKLGSSIFLDNNTPTIIPKIIADEVWLLEINKPKEIAEMIAKTYCRLSVFFSP